MSPLVKKLTEAGVDDVDPQGLVDNAPNPRVHVFTVTIEFSDPVLDAQFVREQVSAALASWSEMQGFAPEEAEAFAEAILVEQAGD